MSESIKKTKRLGLSWDEDFKPRLDDLKFYLQKNTEKNRIAKQKRPTPPRKTDAVRLADIKEKTLAIWQAIALAETKNPAVLLDEDAMYDIIEQYAAGGLMILSAEMDSQLDFAGWLSAKLYKQAERISKTA